MSGQFIQGPWVTQQFLNASFFWTLKWFSRYYVGKAKPRRVELRQRTWQGQGHRDRVHSLSPLLKKKKKQEEECSESLEK